MKVDGETRETPVTIPVFTELAGEKFYDTSPRAGETVTLVRERDNEHDQNAIRVDNSHGQPLGHVPRRTAAWLAGLMDTGQVREKALVTQLLPRNNPYCDHREQTLVRIDMALPQVPEAASGHRRAMLADLWRQLQDVSSWDESRRLGRWCGHLWHHGLTRAEKALLSAIMTHWKGLIPANSDQVELDAVRGDLMAVTIGEARRQGSFRVYPLHRKQTVAAQDYIFLQEAMAQDLATVTEVSAGGSVPDLKVINRSDRIILIPEGEILVGAKQDRTVNVTLMIEPQCERSIPVSCVEQGRWHRTTETFAAGSYATPGVRARKTASVQQNMSRKGEAYSDQGEVWREVADYVAAAGAESATGSLSHAFKAHQEALASLRAAIVLPSAAVGVLVMAGDEIIGMDLYDTSQAMQTIWPRLSEGYFLETILREKKLQAAADDPESVDPDDDVATARCDHAAAVFMESVAQKLEFQNMAGGPHGVGPGRGLKVAGDGLTGSGLWYKGRIVQLGAFRD